MGYDANGKGRDRCFLEIMIPKELLSLIIIYLVINIDTKRIKSKNERIKSVTLAVWSCGRLIVVIRITHKIAIEGGFDLAENEFEG